MTCPPPGALQWLWAALWFGNGMIALKCWQKWRQWDRETTIQRSARKAAER